MTEDWARKISSVWFLGLKRWQRDSAVGEAQVTGFPGVGLVSFDALQKCVSAMEFSCGALGTFI